MGVTGVQEVVSNAVATGAPLHIVHINSSSLWSYQTNLDIILGAQERGADITTEAYPYTAASTGIESALFDDGWQEKMRISYSDVQWQDTGERLTEESFNKYREEGGIVIIHLMKPEWIKAILSDPRVMVASDGMPYAPGAHPRGAGTFSRFLGRYVREQEVISLMGGLAKMTLMPAQRLEAISPQMKRKGRIQIGSDADITDFQRRADYRYCRLRIRPLLFRRCSVRSGQRSIRRLGWRVGRRREAGSGNSRTAGSFLSPTVFVLWGIEHCFGRQYST